MQTDLRKKWAEKTSRAMDVSIQYALKRQLSNLQLFWQNNYEQFPYFYAIVFDSRNTDVSVLPLCSNCIYLDFRGVVWSYKKVTPDDRTYFWSREGDQQFDGFKLRRVESPTPEVNSIICYKVYVPSYTKRFALPSGRKGVIVDGSCEATSFFDFGKVRTTKQKKRPDDFPTDKRKFSAGTFKQAGCWHILSQQYEKETDVVPIHPCSASDMYQNVLPSWRLGFKS